jgi:hypothetical protein
MKTKIIGYALLIIGVLIIITSALGVYFVFSGRINAYKVFDLPAITLDLSGLMEAENPNNELPQASLETELVKSEILNSPLNLAAHLLFMAFMVNVGFKISTLGVQMLRPIKVKVRGDKSILEPS